MTLIEWVTPSEPTLEWLLDTGTTAANIQRGRTVSVATIVGPVGPQGEKGEAGNFTTPDDILDAVAALDAALAL